MYVVSHVMYTCESKLLIFLNYLIGKGAGWNLPNNPHLIVRKLNWKKRLFFLHFPLFLFNLEVNQFSKIQNIQQTSHSHEK